jgi:hypothetical protein
LLDTDRHDQAQQADKSACIGNMHADHDEASQHDHAGDAESEWIYEHLTAPHFLNFVIINGIASRLCLRRRNFFGHQ